MKSNYENKWSDSIRIIELWSIYDKDDEASRALFEVFDQPK